jgi:hypothetical protein
MVSNKLVLHHDMPEKLARDKWSQMPENGKEK